MCLRGIQLRQGYEWIKRAPTNRPDRVLSRRSESVYQNFVGHVAVHSTYSHKRVDASTTDSRIKFPCIVLCRQNRSTEHDHTGLSYGVVCVILHLTVLIQYMRVTDGRTDRRTHDDSTYRANIASRGKIAFQKAWHKWMTLKVTKGHHKWHYSINHLYFVLVVCSNKSSPLHRFYSVRDCLLLWEVHLHC